MSSLNAMDPISETEKEQTQKQQSVVLLATDTTTDTTSTSTDTTTAASDAIAPSWCIFVKTVGKGFDDRRVRDEIADTNDTTNKPTNSSITRPRSSSVDGSFSFDVRVNPENRVDCLHDEIEAVTGVKASQQRLIYRGRLIGKSDVVVAPAAPTNSNNENSNTENNSNYKEKSDALASTSCKPQQEYKIKDIVGLCDGQTIHLVRKRDNSSDAAAAAMDEGSTLNHQNNHNNNNDNDNDDSGTESDTGGGGGGGGGALLAALLGLSETRLSEGLSEDGGGGSPGSSTRGPVSPLVARPGSNNRNATSGPATATATAPNNRSVGSMWSLSRATTATDNDAGEITANTATSNSSSRSPARRNNQNQNRRPHYRLGIEDLEVADPGSMESVRQGLMTLNTIMNSQPPPPRPTHPQQNNYTNNIHNHRSTNIPSGLGAVGEEGSGQQQSQIHHRHHHHPLEVNREWFRGQWIDARDTVNQWLEATVVDILDPKDILDDTDTVASTLRGTNGNRIPISTNAIHARRYWPQPQQELQQPQAQQPRQRRVPNVDNDPAISANDLEGRRRLLLEECEPGDPREITIDGNTDANANASDNNNDNTNDNDNDNNTESDQFPEVATHHGTNSNTNINSSQSQSFRPRASNSNGVKVLLIHYNGWPHRWDEWIRSDSERLRPFRTRTRHPNTSSIASPTPQSIFNEAPRTNIIEDGDEEEDRFAVLPELNIVLSQVSELLGDLVQRERGQERDDNNSNNNQSKDDLDEDDELEDLRPLNVRNANNNDLNVNYHGQRATADLPWMARYAEEDVDNDHSNEATTAAAAAAREREHATTANDGLPSTTCTARNMYNQGELRNLATLLDRLGRTLTDVAPHIASIAGSLPAEDHTTEWQNAPATAENSNSYDSAPLGGLLSLWSRERERARRNNNNADDQENATTARPTISAATVDPDHIDFASGIVNTTRGEVRSGPRNRASHQDDVASLLGTYLAAASLGSAVGVGSNDDTNASGATSSLARLLQRGSGGGSGDNGIDIHIHAIVTAPGVSPGGMGIATLSSSGGSPTATLGGARNLFSSNRNSLRADGGILRSGASMASNNNFVEPTNEEDYSDLFSELYSESPTPIDPNGSPVRGENNESIASSSSSAANNINTANSTIDDGGGGGDTNGPDNICSPGNNLSNHIEQQQQLDSTGDASLMTPPSNRSRSSPRRPSSSRGSGVFRLFRRRGSRANNPDGSNNEDTT